MRAAVAACAIAAAAALSGPLADDALALRKGQVLRVTATAYTGGGTTFTGRPTGPGVCAVDPTVIPLGTRFEVQGYGRCVAADIGGSIVGRRIDVWLSSERKCLRWGVRDVRIRIIRLGRR